MKKSLLVFALFSLVSIFQLSAKDNVPPSIQLLKGKRQKIQLADVFVLSEPKAVSDNITDSAQIIVRKKWSAGGPVNTTIRNQYALYIEAEDLDANIAYDTIIFIVDDFIPPVINLNTADQICTEYNQPYRRVTPTATDNYYSSNNVSLSLISSDVDPNSIGLYQDVYEAIDASGNKTVKIRIVEVKINCSNPSSIETKNTSNVLVFPNPVIDLLMFQSVFNLSKACLSLYDMNGRLVYLQNNANGFSVSELPNGIYQLRIVSDELTHQTLIHVIH